MIYNKSMTKMSISDHRRLFVLGLGAVLATAVTQPLLSAPFSWWPLHWISWVPFLWALSVSPTRRRISLSILAGTVANLLIFYWMINLMPNFTNIALPVSIIMVVTLCGYLALNWMLLAWVVPKLWARFPRTWFYLAPTILVTGEFFLPQLFPYMQGASHYQVLPIAQLSSITGIYGVSFLLFFANCVIFHILKQFGERRVFAWKPLVVLVILVGLVLGYGLSRIETYNQRQAGARTLTVGLIQSNYRPADHRELGFQSVHNTYLDLSREAAEKGAEWIIWSEGEFSLDVNGELGRRILTQASATVGRPILTGGYGGEIVEGKRRFRNSAIHADPKDGLGRRYDKRVLVPFGEYMPLDRYLSFIYDKINWRSRFYPGEDPMVQQLEGIPYGFLICYEAIYPKLSRDAVNDGARLLVNVTYDAWFGRTTAPYQHLMLAVIRSTETGVPMIRLATTGVSTTADALGRMSTLTPLYERNVAVHKIPLVYMKSIYTSIGDLFAWLCVLICLGSIGIVLFRPIAGGRRSTPTHDLSS